MKDICVNHNVILESKSPAWFFEPPIWWQNYVSHCNKITIDLNYDIDEFIYYIECDLKANYDIGFREENNIRYQKKFVTFESDESYTAFVLRWS